ncbi:MAG: hypothetical protein ABID64_00165 [Nitrospirota bacterium]
MNTLLNTIVDYNSAILAVGTIVALLLIATWAFLYSDFVYGYRNGLRTIKQLGKNLWAQRDANANVATQMTTFTDEVVHLSVSNKLSFYDEKVAILNEKLEKLKSSKESCEKEIMSLSSNFDSSILKMNRNFDDLGNIDIENDINNIKSTFEDEYIIKKNALENHFTALNEEIEKCNSKIRTLTAKIEDLSFLNSKHLESLGSKFIKKLKKLKSTLVIISLFIMEFFMTYINFKGVLDVYAMNDPIWAIIPPLAGLFFPILFIGIFGIIVEFHKNPGIVKRTLAYLVFSLNGVSLLLGIGLFVIVMVGDNVDSYTNMMWRLFLFPVVLLTAWLLSKEGTQNDRRSAFAQYDFLFVIPELLIYGMLLVILYVYNFFSLAVKSLSLHMCLWASKSEKNRTNKQKVVRNTELEQFRAQYIDNLAKIFEQEGPREILLQKIDDLKKGLLKDLGELTNAASKTVNHLTKKIDKRIKKISSAINKYRKHKLDMIDGVHLATKRFKIRKSETPVA